MKPRAIAPPNPIIRAAWEGLRKQQAAEAKAARKEPKQAASGEAAAKKMKARKK